MARQELKHCEIILRDGFKGVGKVDDDSIVGGDTILGVDELNLVDSLTVVPIGARFEIEGVTGRRVVTGQTANKVVEVVCATAAGGDITLAINGEALEALDHDDGAQDVQAAVDLAIGEGKVVVTGTDITTGWEFEFVGSLGNSAEPTLTIVSDDLEDNMMQPVDATINVEREGGVTYEIEFDVPLASGNLPSDGAVITFYPNQLTIKIGDGDLSYEETDEYTYDLDRGLLDTVRQADEQPLQVNLNFVLEHVTTGTNETIAPMDALKRRRSATHWVNAADDPCEPYAVDLMVIHTPPCGSQQKEFTLFPDFRSTSRSVQYSDSNIEIQGTCNVTEPVVWRGELSDEPVAA